MSFTAVRGIAPVSAILKTSTNYQFRLYEYRRNIDTGNYALYQLGNAASGSQNTDGTTSQTRPRFDFYGDGKSDISIYRPSVENGGT
jgi:hypothetical protein